MKKCIFLLSTLALSATQLFAASDNVIAQQSQAQMSSVADCSKMSTAEQSFAGQLTDVNNKAMFCSQFTPQQRQQAMQMSGQMDASGNRINPDQAVQQVMASASIPATQPRVRSGGGCPVK
jgi:hypothetical protein